MVEFMKWFALTVFILRWAVWGYVVSKHGEEKKVEKYNAFSELIGTAIVFLYVYTLWFCI